MTAPNPDSADYLTTVPARVRPNFEALWAEYCRTTPVDQRVPQVEFIRQVRRDAIAAGDASNGH